jgi:hypothetical protein
MNPTVDQFPHADVSRRDVVVRLGAGGVAALLLAATRSMGGTAQDASPAASPVGAVGVTAQPMGVGQPTTAPGLELSLRRITIAPGGAIPAHSHPGALVIFVEAGTFGYTTLGGTAQLTRAAAEGTPAPAEAMPMGTEVLLNPGDWLFTEDPEDDVRNAGEDDVVLLVAGLTQVGEPFTTFL